MASRRSSRKTAELTSTSFALLGLLSIRPWTTYELAGQMERGMGKFWPRARSMLFKEPEKLIDRGLATAAHETVGRRARTVYSITPKGKRALRRWLREPGGPPQIEWEALLKVFFADAGTKDDLLGTLAQIREWAAEAAHHHRAKARTYLDEEGPFQQRAAILALTGDFITSFDALVGEWATRATAIVEQWPDDPSDAEPEWAFFERVAQRRPRRSGARP